MCSSKREESKELLRTSLLLPCRYLHEPFIDPYHSLSGAFILDFELFYFREFFCDTPWTKTKDGTLKQDTCFVSFLSLAHF